MRLEIDENILVYFDPTDIVKKHGKKFKALSVVVEEMEIEYFEPRATFYIWAKTPKSTPSIDFCSELLTTYGIVTTPGIGFGEEGEGFFRFSLTVPEEKIKEGSPADVISRQMPAPFF